MDNLEVFQTEDNLEGSENTDRIDEQALEDTTHEPGTRVEQTQDFEQAEAVEGALAEVMSNAEATVGSRPEIAGKPEAPESKAKDPLTGKGHGEQSQTPGGDSEQEEPTMAASSGKGETQVGVVSSEKSIEQGKPSEVPLSEIDGNERVYQVGDQEGDNGAAINASGAQSPGAEAKFGPQRLDVQLPKERLFPEGRPGMQGPKGGGHKKPGTPPSSGGGPPVGGRGGGSRGQGTGREETFEEFQDRRLREMGMDDMADEEKEKQMQERTLDLYEMEQANQKGNTIDGDQPMPYTGSSGGGEKPNPDEPTGGPLGDSGKISPLIPKGGGRDSGGGKTPGDKDGDDDSGKFLGDPDLSGGYDGTLDPGGLDYNQANTLENDAKGATKK